MTKVYILDRFHQKAIDYLNQQPHLQLVLRSDYKIDSSLHDADALVIRSKSQITKDNLKSLPNLKYLVTATSGFDHIDYHACQEKNIFCDYCPDANAASAAELCFAHLLNLSRDLNTSCAVVKNGEWKAGVALGSELSGKKILIIGLGRIGRRVAKMATAFDMQVMYYDPYVEAQVGLQKFDSLEEAIEAADIITLHTPKTKKTSPLIKMQHLANFRSEQILINVARGDAVEESLIIHLIEKKLRLALDVFASEPLTPSSPLLTADNLSLSPHIGAYTEEAYFKASMQAAQKLTDFFSGRAESASIPPQVAWVQDVDY